MAHEEKVIEYISSEIKSQIENMTTWRSRASLSVFLGPYVLLGTVLIATKGLQISFKAGILTPTLAVIGIVFCFIGLGLVSAIVEEHSWNHCNKLRSLIAKLQSGKVTELADDDLVFFHKTRRAYFITYLLLIISFLFALVIISQLR